MSKIAPFFVTIVASWQYNVLMDKWSIAHRYKKLVEAGVASPLTAPDGTAYILKANKEFEPVYWNPVTDAIYTPGAAKWLEMRSKIDQLDLDSLDTGLVS